MSQIITTETETMRINPILNNPKSLEELLLSPEKRIEIPFVEVSNSNCSYNVEFRKSPKLNTYCISSGVNFEYNELDQFNQIKDRIQRNYSQIYLKTRVDLSKYSGIDLNKIINLGPVYYYSGNEFKIPNTPQIIVARELLEIEIAKAILLTNAFYRNLSKVVFSFDSEKANEVEELFNGKNTCDNKEAYKLFLDENATQLVKNTLQGMEFMTQTADELVNGKKKSHMVN